MASLLNVRSTAHEFLDADELDALELRKNLREMAMLNRLPGGVGDSVRAVERLLGEQNEATVLDVGTGSGDFVRRLRRRRHVEVIALDVRPEVLEIAARNLAGTNNVSLLQADARAIPLADGEVDIAHASLLMHHFDPDDAIVALAEMRRVSRLGVVINDLRRGVVPFAMTAAAVLALSRGAYTRHDGVLSARRAYTLAELDTLAARAGLERAHRSGRLWPRVTTVYR
ncbi:MAG TPA: methyltransferase domain-containing protein [Candidatus Limnocylindria bacterium]|nr:methyltransferase domain-containing protein [Candidatus Limnocylindria bacterium]